MEFALLSTVLASTIFLHQGRLVFGMYVDIRNSIRLLAHAHRCNNLADGEVDMVLLLYSPASDG